jgi:hypothetical protein
MSLRLSDRENPLKERGIKVMVTNWMRYFRFDKRETTRYSNIPAAGQETPQQQQESSLQNYSMKSNDIDPKQYYPKFV